MRKTITKKWLKDKNACRDGVEWFLEQKDKSTTSVIKQLKKENKHDWLNWLLARLMNYKQYVSYAVYTAEQVIDIYEKKYPNDGRPRDAIEAAKRCIESPTKKNKDATYVATYVAYTYAAYAYAAATDDKMKLKIINYGIKILRSTKCIQNKQHK